MKRMLLITDKNTMSGMFQLARDMKGDIYWLRFNNPLYRLFPFLDKFNFNGYDEVVTFLYPLHIFGKRAKKQGLKWINYDNGIPPITKEYFPNFFRRQYMRLFNRLNNKSMKGADEYWELSEREQKPRWTKKKKFSEATRGGIYEGIELNKPYAIYLGRTTDYKNFKWLKKTMKGLNIPLLHPKNATNDFVHVLLSNAKLYVTASLWEGYGRGCGESQKLNIYTICFDTGVHKRLVKYGDVIPNGDFELFKEKVKEFWNGYGKKKSNNS